MKKEYKFSGSTSGKATIILEDDKLTIKRNGFMSLMSHGLKGEKTIIFNSITGIQYKASGISAGYLQIIVMGSHESKGGLQDAMNDENTVGFIGKKYNKQALEIKNFIEQYISNRDKAKYTIKESDKYDQLAKIKKLLDDGILTQEEFEKEKNRILQ